MMKPLKAALVMIVSVLAIGGGYVVAQQEDALPPSEKAPLLEADAIEREARQLTSEEKLEVCEDRIKSMRKVLGQTSELLQKVRETEEDILKINCINEKLAAIKGFLKVSEQSYTNLSDAVSRDDEQAEVHHFTLVAIASKKVEELGEEAQTCVGDVQLFADETIVERRENPDIADVDPIIIDNDEVFDEFATETLPELTPFQ